MHEMEQNSKAPNVCMIVGAAQVDKKKGVPRTIKGMPQTVSERT